ncbi:MAG TPA: tetratricopeptide repeat protein, partial [Candidatus Edwardsbacteria bacterium]|nr:tetratricopeptide repeat protein [Candidatus Edwardsbacteria bacterium]
MKHLRMTTMVQLGLAVALLFGCATASLAGKPKPEDLMQEAIQADQGGDYDKAVALLRQVTMMKAKDKVLAEAHYRLGMFSLESGKYEEAIGSLKIARELKYPDADKQLGIAYHKQGSLDEAEAIFKQLLAAAPNNTDLMYRLGKVYLDKGMLNEAGELFRQVLQIDPNNGAAHNGLANLYYRQRKLTDAMAEYSQALQFDPNLSDANLDLGNAYFAKGEYTQAAECFRKYTVLAPKDAAGFFMYAKALQSQHNEALLPEATEAAKKSVKLDGENDGAWYVLATLYRDSKQYRNSLQAFNRSLVLSSVDPQRWYEAGKVYVESGKQYLDAKDTANAHAQLDSAVLYYKSAQTLNLPETDQLLYDIGTAFYLAGNYDEAISWFNQRIARSPATAYSAYMNLGYSLSLKAQGMKMTAAPEKAAVKQIYLQAVTSFLEAKKLKSGDARPMEALAQHYYYLFKNFGDKPSK